MLRAQMRFLAIAIFFVNIVFVFAQLEKCFSSHCLLPYSCIRRGNTAQTKSARKTVGHQLVCVSVNP